MTNQTFDHDPSGRECALAGRDPRDPSACKACLADIARERIEAGRIARLDAYAAAADAVVAFPKTMLTERRRGKGGSLVTLRAGSWSARFGVGPFVVKDLAQRKTFNDPLGVGVGPVDGGLAWGVLLADIVNVRVAQA